MKTVYIGRAELVIISKTGIITSIYLMGTILSHDLFAEDSIV